MAYLSRDWLERSIRPS